MSVIDGLLWAAFRVFAGFVVAHVFWPRRPKQRTFVYCPGCRNEMAACPRTTYAYVGELFVRYDCGQCHVRSLWQFDMPVPILLRRESNSTDAAVPMPGGEDAGK